MWLGMAKRRLNEAESQLPISYLSMPKGTKNGLTVPKPAKNGIEAKRRKTMSCGEIRDFYPVV